MAKRKAPRIPGNGGRNNLIMASRTAIRNEIRADRNFTRQFVTDAAVLAVHDVFGAGEKRVADFLVALNDNLMKMSEITLEDAKDDSSIVYMKAKMDEALKPLLGRNFQPYDERYRL